MPIDPDLLSILICPESKQPLREADASLIEGLNGRIDAGSLRNRGGSPVTQRLQEGLVREDGKLLYPIQDGIPTMLIEEAIEL